MKKQLKRLKISDYDLIVINIIKKGKPLVGKKATKKAIKGYLQMVAEGK
jgi:hypothetical protein